MTCRLYLITPPNLEPNSFGERLRAALDAGDVACVQLRLKDVDEATVRQAVKALKPIAQERDVAFILNNLPILAAETGCDGVHVGQQDMAYETAREVMGSDAIVGVTCHASRHLATEAADAGADYVAFGAFFPTETKDAKARADEDILRWWSETMIVPCVAIGGITARNCGPLVAAGADFLAVISAVWDHPDGPAVAVREFNLAIEKAIPN